MSLGTPGRSQEPIHVVPMALALVLAAFAGGSLGLVWHKLNDDSPPPAAEEPAEEEPAEEEPAEEATPTTPPTSAPPVGR